MLASLKIIKQTDEFTSNQISIFKNDCILIFLNYEGNIIILQKTWKRKKITHKTIPLSSL